MFYLFSNIVGNGRGGESIYGGFFEGKEAVRLSEISVVIQTDVGFKVAVQSYPFPPR